MKKTLKIFFIISLFILINTSFVYASSHNVEALINREVKITYNSQILKFRNANGEDVYPISYNGTTYLPVRAISSLFRIPIIWLDATNSIVLGDGQIDNDAAYNTNEFFKGYSENIFALLNEDISIYANNEKQSFTDANGNTVFPLSFEGTTYLPVRAIAVLYNISVNYNSQSNEVILNKIAVADNKKTMSLKPTKEIDICGYYISSKNDPAFFINGRIVSKGNSYYGVDDLLYCNKKDFELIYACKDYFDIVVAMKKRPSDVMTKEFNQGDEYDLYSYYFKDKLGNKIENMTFEYLEEYLINTCGLPKPGAKAIISKYKITDLEKDSYYGEDGFVPYQHFTYSNDKVSVTINDYVLFPLANNKTYNIEIKCVKNVNNVEGMKLIDYRQEFVSATIVSKKDLK